MTTIRYSMVRWRSHRNRWPSIIRRTMGVAVLFVVFMIGFWMLMSACDSNMMSQ